MNPDNAKAIAAVLYHGREDWSGYPEFDHLAAVAAALPDDNHEVVAWLHDAVEDKLVTFGALRDAGLNDIQHKALFLLTRVSEDGTYIDYIRNIAKADGEAGAIARAVKLKDNQNNCERPCPADKQGMRAPGGRYDKARKILTGQKA